MMQSGTFWINSTGSAHVFEGQGEIRLPSKGVTNVLTAESQFDSETGKVTVFDNTLSKEERHNLWLPSDPLFVGWATPKVITPESLDRFRTPNRPF